MSTQPSQVFDTAAVEAMVHGAVPALSRFGVRVLEVGPGLVRLLMPLAGNANHLGTMYAGALFAVAELPAGILPGTVPAPGAVVPIARAAELRFLRPATTDVTVTAQLDPQILERLLRTAVQEGRAELELAISVVDARGAEVATATTSTLLRRAPGPPAAGGPSAPEAAAPDRR